VSSRSKNRGDTTCDKFTCHPKAGPHAEKAPARMPARMLKKAPARMLKMFLKLAARYDNLIIGCCSGPLPQPI
jgi:hypothetical protein